MTNKNDYNHILGILVPILTAFWNGSPEILEQLMPEFGTVYVVDTTLGFYKFLRHSMRKVTETNK
jgi:hypothetical protein